MEARSLSLEDIIAAEVKRVASAGTASSVPASGGIGGFDIKGITQLLGEINKLAAHVNLNQGSNQNPGVINVQPQPQPQLNTPTQNPQPQQAKKPNPEKVYAAIYDTLGKLMGIMGDVKLSEVRAFMDENRDLVVSVIGSNMDGFDL